VGKNGDTFQSKQIKTLEMRVLSGTQTMYLALIKVSNVFAIYLA